MFPKTATRIGVSLSLIEKIWRANPDLRLMQLLLNAIGVYDNNFPDLWLPKDHYNTSDTLVRKLLKEQYRDYL